MPLKMSILTDNGMFESHINTCLIIIQMKPANNQLAQLEMKKTTCKPKLDSNKSLCIQIAQVFVSQGGVA